MGRDDLIPALVLVIIANVAVIALAFGGWRRRRDPGRLATYVALELVGPGLPLVAHAPDSAVRLERSATQVLTQMTRRGDAFRRDGRGGFRVLLEETDEAAAGAYVQRVGRSLEPRLRTPEGPFGIMVGWASPLPGSDLSSALELAEARLSTVVDQLRRPS